VKIKGEYKSSALKIDYLVIVSDKKAFCFLAEELSFFGERNYSLVKIVEI
jgi:hypothetical protein